MKYLLDTNIISELRKKSPNEKLVKWMKERRASQLYVSSLTIGELRMGALKKRKKDPIAGKFLFNWLEEVMDLYSNQMVLVDLSVCEKWADFLSIDSTNAVDSLLLAQAVVNNMILVTRNVKHFKIFEVDICNPFE